MSEKEKVIDLFGLLHACLHRIPVILAATLLLGMISGLFQYAKLNRKDSDGNSAISSYAEQLAEYQSTIEQYDSQLENVEEKIQNEYQPWNSNFFDAWDSIYQTTLVFTVPHTSDAASAQREISSFVTLWNESDLFTEMELNHDAYYTALLTEKCGNVLHDKVDLFISLFADNDDVLVLNVLGESPEKAEELADKAESFLIAKWNASSLSRNPLIKADSSSQKVFEYPDSEQTDVYSTLINRRNEIDKEKSAIAEPTNPRKVIVKWGACGALLGFVVSIAWVCLISICHQTFEHDTSAEMICGIPMIGSKKAEPPYLAEQLKILSNQYGKILILSDVSVSEKDAGSLCSEKVRFSDDFFRNKDALGALETSDAVILLGKTGASSAAGFERIRSFAANINKPTIGYIMK